MFYDIKLTNQAVKAAQRIDGKDTEYRVTGKTYLRILVYQTRISLAVRLYYRHKPYFKTLGHYPHLDLKTFERLADEYVARIKGGGHFALGYKVTLDEFYAEIVVVLQRKRKLATWRENLARYDRHISPVLGRMVLLDIRPYHIQMLLNGLPANLAPATQNRIRSVLHRALSIAVNLEIVDRNPCSNVPTQPELNVVERFLTPQESWALIAVLLQNVQSFHHLALILAILLGARISNILSITRDMLAPDLSTITFPKTKSGKPLQLPLSDQAQWVVQQALSLAHEPFLFPSSRSESGYITYPVAQFRRACIEAGISVKGGKHAGRPGFPAEELTIHGLRKGLGGAVQTHTKDIHCTSTLLGHADPTITARRYAFFLFDQKRDAMQGAAQLLTSGVPGFPKLPD